MKKSKPNNPLPSESLTPAQKRLMDSMEALNTKFSGKAFEEFLEAADEYYSLPVVQQEIILSTNLL
jgi:hypothetical protein